MYVGRTSRLSFLTEVPAILFAAPRVELARRRHSLHIAVESFRKRAANRQSRSPENRTRLKRAIAVVDARLPGGPNCVRRSLLEVALDRGAAAEKLFAGFKAGGGAQSGHAWLASDPVPTEHYDAIITI